MKQFLKGKTIVLVTHQLQFLNRADKIVVLKDGQTVAIGSYEELCNSSMEFLAFLDNQREEERRRKSMTKEKSLSIRGDSEDNEKEETKDQSKTSKTKVDRSEAKSGGTVSMHIYWQYFKAGRSMVS